jgi:alpha-L-fucosidase
MKTTCSFLTVLLIVSQLGISAQETPEEKETRMQWFSDARLGIFIHWGIYAVNGIDESWSSYKRERCKICGHHF